MWRGDYETGNFGQWVEVQASRTNPSYPVSSVGDSAAEIIDAPVRQGSYGARFVTYGGGRSSTDVERAEVYASVAATGAQEGADRWYAWSTNWPSAGNTDGFPKASGDFNVFTQWHNANNACGDNLQLGIDARSAPGPNELYSDLNGHSGGACDEVVPLRHARLARLVFDRWYDFVVHVHWSTRPDTGYYELWLNGVQVVRRTYGATMWDTSGAYWKQGFYRAAFAGTNTVYQDGAVSSASLDAAVRSFRLRFREPPKVLPNGAISVDAGSFAGARVQIVARDSNGHVVGRARGTANGDGVLQARVRLRRGSVAGPVRVVLLAGVSHRLPLFTRRAESDVR